MKYFMQKTKKEVPHLLFLMALVLFTSCFRTEAEQSAAKADKPFPFGYKCIWLTVPANDPTQVANFLGLKRQKIINWAKGVEQAYSDGIFVSPPINNSIFIVGVSLPGLDEKSNIANAIKLANDLSQKYGAADYFVTNRIIEHHGWLKSVNGKLVRAYAYLGESGENTIVRGTPSKFEAQFLLINTLAQSPLNNQSQVIPDETFVMRVAENWGINPTTIDKRTDTKPGLGVIGYR